MNTNLRLNQPAKTKYNWLKTLTMVLLLGGFANVNAQVSAYTVTQQNTNTFTNLTKTNISEISGNVDNGIYALPFPGGFTFAFNGKCYTSANVSLNGFLSFGAATLATDATPISSSTAYEGVIAPYGNDLDLFPANGTSGNVGYVLQGSAPNRILKIQWGVKRHNSTASAGQLEATTFAFQVWLHETTNIIDLVYNNFAPPAPNTTAGQVGLRGATNADYKNLSWAAGNWPAGGMAAGGSNAATVFLASTAVINAASFHNFRFTPPTCVAPTGVNASLVAETTATAGWTAPCPAPANGYEYEIRTSGAAGSGATGLVTSGTTASTSVPLSGLTVNTTYTIYVRSDCGGTFSPWTTGVNFTTLCGAVFPYFLYFDPFSDGFTVPNLPTCTSRQQVGTGNLWVTDATVEEGFFDEHLMYNQSTTNAANVWFFTKGITMTGGTTYRLSYTYGGSTTFAFLTNKMEIRYGTSPSAVAMAAGTQLADHDDIKDSPLQNVINFTPASSGTYYIGFRAYSAASNGRLFLDDIECVVATCLAPTSLIAGQITPASATITWTPPATPPGSGYQYYLSTSVTPPTSATTPTGIVPAGNTIANLSSLSPSTTYYFWVRSNCGSGDISGWSSTYGTFTTPAFPSVSYCTPSGAGFAQDPNGITNVTMGTINNNTGLELPNYYGNYSNLITSVAQGANFVVNVTYATGFTYDTTIWVDWNNDGDFADAGELMVQGNSTNAVPTTLTLNFTVPAGAPLGTHRIRIGGCDFGPLTDPCRMNTWQAFEDYTLYVIAPPPPLTLSASTATICAGVNSPTFTMTSAVGNYTTYAWTPTNGVSGDAVGGYIFNPTSTTVYTLTGFNSSTLASNTFSVTINVNQPPTAITVASTPVAGTMCQGQTPVQLTASGGIVSGVSIYFEGFNGGTMPTGWTSTNTSTGNVAPQAWIVHPDGYNLGGTWGQVVHSNDNSPFIISNSDAGGFGSVTATTLTSPPIFLDNAIYTTASLSFWHFFEKLFGDNCQVLLSTDGTNFSTVLATYTTQQGSETNFVNAVYDLTSYIGQTIYIRFKYDATWDWGWALDNFLISGSGTSAISWTPATGLYTNAIATIPYVAGAGAATVYASPASTTVYTASATSGLGCTQYSAPVTVTVTPLAVGVAAPATQTISCNGIVTSNLTVASATPGVTRWEYSSTPGFAVFSPIAVASTTLTPAQITAAIGPLTADTYFRAVVTNGTCTTYSTVLAVIYDRTTYTGTWSNGLPTASKAVTFASGTFTSTGNINACSVTVTGGTVTIASGHTLTVENAVTVTGGSLTFNDDSSLVQVNNSAVNSGPITYNRQTTQMIQYDYTYWSSPLSPQTLVGLSPLTAWDKYFQFNATAGTYQNVAANSLMVPGRGYIIRAPQNFNATPQFFNGVFNGGSNDGVPNNGVITHAIIGPNNFNLIGNPYPSALDANLFYAANNTLIDGNFYFWTHNTGINPTQYTQSDYAQWNATGGIGTPGGGVGNPNVPTKNIAAGQGFFVRGIANGTATFNNSMRLAGNNANFYRPAAQQTPYEDGIEKHRIWLQMTNESGAYKQTLVGYIQGATNEKDNGFDGTTADGGYVIGLYSVLNAENLGIQGRALPFDANDQVPLGYKSTIAGTFQIALSAVDGLFTNADQDIYLEDKLLNIFHNLRNGSYTFTTAVGTFNDRFVLRYNNGTALGVNNPVFSENSVIVYKDDSGLHIETANIVMDNVKIYDVRGRLVMTKNHIDATEITISDLSVAEEVLILRIESDDNRIVNKKVVY